jgi:hypothetical protein
VQSWLVLACVACLATGCGRLEFADAIRDAAVPDAVAGHDEDGDGIPDPLDPCPHLAGDDVDSDGDGIGDACDPNPTSATETLLLFATLQPGDHPFESIVGMTQQADALNYTGLGLPLAITQTVGTVRVDVGFDIRALFGTDQHQISSGVDRGAFPYYFVELNDHNGNQWAAVTAYSGTGYSQIAIAPHGGMHPGRGVVRYDAIMGAAPAFRLEAGWVGEMYVAVGATPAYAGGTVIRFVLNGLDIDLEYVFIVGTN